MRLLWGEADGMSFEGQLMASCNSCRITFTFKWNLPLLVLFSLEHTQKFKMKRFLKAVLVLCRLDLQLSKTLTQYF
jgi:hypothetical protein